jgi:hypothetical protein
MAPLRQEVNQHSQDDHQATKKRKKENSKATTNNSSEPTPRENPSDGSSPPPTTDSNEPLKLRKTETDLNSCLQVKELDENQKKLDLEELGITSMTTSKTTTQAIVNVQDNTDKSNSMISDSIIGKQIKDQEFETFKELMLKKPIRM